MRLWVAGEIKQVERDPFSTVLFKLGGDCGVLAGPVSLEEQNIVFGKEFLHFVRIQNGEFGHFAGDAPVGGEVDEDGAIFSRVLNYAG